MEINKEIASDDDLSSCSGIIYAIQNKFDGKIYIGATKTTFNQRYKNNWKNKTVNKCLKGILNKYPNNPFDIFILEKNIQDVNELMEKEVFWAENLNTYCPFGYNVRECGNGGQQFFDIKVKKINREKTLKTYFLKNIITKEIFEINDLIKFCEEKKIKVNCIRNLLCGLVLSSQDYCLPETTDEQLFEKYMKNAKQYTIKHIKTGEIITFKNVAYFTTENGLEENSFRCMLCGAHKTSQGYCLPSHKNKITTYFFQHENGEILKTTRLKDLSESGINAAALVAGRSKKSKGWTFLMKEVSEY